MTTLYYCKNVQKWTQIVSADEVYQGTTLDDQSGNPFVDLAVFNVKAVTAQAELEQSLVCKFDLVKVRLSSCDYLEYAHAIITWFHLEINGQIRDLIQKKYDLVMAKLLSLDCIINSDGTVLAAIMPSKGSSPSGSRVAYRELDLNAVPGRYPEIYDPRRMPVRPTIYVNPRCR